VAVDVEDILARGGDREPGRRRRWLVAVAIVVVAGIVVVRHLPGGPGGRPLPAVSGQQVPRLLPGRASLSAGSGGITGPGLPVTSSIRLPVAGSRPVWFWPATGRTKPIGGLPWTGAGYTFLRAVGGWALVRSTFARTECGTCAGSALPVYFLADSAGSARWVGTADAVAPAAAAGALWLISYRLGADPATAVGTAREVGASGRLLGPAVRLPFGYTIDRATEAGLLLAPVQQPGGPATYLLWNPGSGRISRRFDDVIAASPQEIAWMPPCARRCVTDVADLATGRVIVVRLPIRERAADAAFSPDGGYLALRVIAGGHGSDGGLAVQLEVASLRTGGVSQMPGMRVSSNALIGFGWPDGIDSLVAELSFPAKVQIAAWRLWAACPAVAALAPGSGATGLVVG
jgi:hypothetical protein